MRTNRYAVRSFAAFTCCLTKDRTELSSDDRHFEHILLSYTIGSSAVIKRKELQLAADLRGSHDLLNKNIAMQKVDAM